MVGDLPCFYPFVSSILHTAAALSVKRCTCKLRCGGAPRLSVELANRRDWPPRFRVQSSTLDCTLIGQSCKLAHRRKFNEEIYTISGYVLKVVVLCKFYRHFIVSEIAFQKKIFFIKFLRSKVHFLFACHNFFPSSLLFEVFKDENLENGMKIHILLFSEATWRNTKTSKRG